MYTYTNMRQRRKKARARFSFRPKYCGSHMHRAHMNHWNLSSDQDFKFNFLIIFECAMEQISVMFFQRIYISTSTRLSPCVAFISHSQRRVVKKKTEEEEEQCTLLAKIFARIMNNRSCCLCFCCCCYYCYNFPLESHGWHQFINKCVNELDFSWLVFLFLLFNRSRTSSSLSRHHFSLRCTHRERMRKSSLVVRHFPLPLHLLALLIGVQKKGENTNGQKNDYTNHYDQLSTYNRPDFLVSRLKVLRNSGINQHIFNEQEFVSVTPYRADAMRW